MARGSKESGANVIGAGMVTCRCGKRIIGNFQTCQQKVGHVLDLVGFEFWFGKGSFESRHRVVSFVVVFIWDMTVGFWPCILSHPMAKCQSMGKATPDTSPFFSISLIMKRECVPRHTVLSLFRPPNSTKG